jgi:hypothetical protein
MSSAGLWVQAMLPLAANQSSWGNPGVDSIPAHNIFALLTMQEVLCASLLAEVRFLSNRLERRHLPVLLL